MGYWLLGTSHIWVAYRLLIAYGLFNHLAHRRDETRPEGSGDALHWLHIDHQSRWHDNPFDHGAFFSKPGGIGTAKSRQSVHRKQQSRATPGHPEGCPKHDDERLVASAESPSKLRHQAGTRESCSFRAQPKIQIILQLTTTTENKSFTAIQKYSALASL